MNEEQGKIFSQILDVNYELKTEVFDDIKSFLLRKKLWALKEELIVSMGLEKYEEFIENGKKMFSEVKQEEY